MRLLSSGAVTEAFELHGQTMASRGWMAWIGNMCVLLEYLIIKLLGPIRLIVFRCQIGTRCFFRKLAGMGGCGPSCVAELVLAELAAQHHGPVT